MFVEFVCCISLAGLNTEDITNVSVTWAFAPSYLDVLSIKRTKNFITRAKCMPFWPWPPNVTMAMRFRPGPYRQQHIMINIYAYLFWCLQANKKVQNQMTCIYIFDLLPSNVTFTWSRILCKTYCLIVVIVYNYFKIQPSLCKFWQQYIGQS